MLILLWLIDRGVPSPLVAAAIRHQVCPQVTLIAGSARAVILDRCVGGLTGSRVIAIWHKLGFRLTGESVLCDVHRQLLLGFMHSCRCSCDFGRSGNASVVQVELENEAFFQIVR